jgi:hypothetical protein
VSNGVASAPTPHQRKRITGKRMIRKRFEDFKELERMVRESEAKRPWRNQCSFPALSTDSFTGFGVDKFDPEAAFVIMRRDHLERFCDVSGFLL